MTPPANSGRSGRILSIPEPLWTPLVSALITLVPGIIGIALDRIALFPSLGPSALMQAHRPEDASSRFYNVVVSHLAGFGSAALAVTVFGIAQAPSVFEVHSLSGARVGACVLAVALAAALELLLRASHPPAASTTLLVALGSFHPTVQDGLTVALGVLVVAGVGELFRRSRARAGP